MALPIQERGCNVRMFVSCMCLADEDIERLDLLPDGPTCCLSAQTQARSILHRLIAEDEMLAQAVTDILDLRHLDDVARVRAESVEEIHGESQVRGRTSCGESLVGWAWALLTDAREDVRTLGKNLMGECYVRGMRALAEPRRSPSQANSTEGRR